MEGHVLQPWVASVPFKCQSILLSGLRGPDQALHPKIKQVSKWVRAVSQINADPSKPYMNNIRLPEPEELEKELEHCYVHFVHHFADALAVIAYWHPDRSTALTAAQYHHYIAEELFHFRPEPRDVFIMRHRNKLNGVDEQANHWQFVSTTARADYLNDVLARFLTANAA
jgi:hypothetical protein